MTVAKTYCKTALPIVLGMLVNYLIPLTDVLMVSRLGTTQLAATSLSADLFGFLSVFPVGLAYGLTPFLRKITDQKSLEETRAWFFASLTLNFLAALLFALVVVASIYGLPYLKQSPEVTAWVPAYLPWVAFSLIPQMIYNTCSRCLEGMVHTKPILHANLLGLLCNILLNYLFIHGKAGFPALGIAGAGLATLCSKVTMMLFLGKVVCNNLKISLKPQTLQKEMLQKLWALGMPIGFQFTLEFAFFSLSGLMVGWLGTSCKATNAIIESMFSIPMSVIWAFSLAASAAIANASKGQPLRLVRVGLICYGVSGAVVFPLLATVFYYAPELFALYGGHKEGYALAHAVIPWAMAFGCADFLYTMVLGFLRGMHDTFFPFVVSSLSNGLVGLPLCYFFTCSLHWGMVGIWVGKLIPFFLSAVILFLRFLKKRGG